MTNPPEPPKSGLTDDAVAEIKAAIKILKEDGFHVTRIMDKLAKKKDAPPSDPKPSDAPPKDGDVPPPKDEPNEPTEAKRRGVWWGDQKDDE